MAETFMAADVETGVASVLARELPGGAVLQISAWPDSAAATRGALSELTGTVPPHQPDTVARGQMANILSTGPHRWVVIMPIAAGPVCWTELRARLTHQQAAIVDLSASLRCFEISGPNARVFLSKMLPLDFDPRVFPADHCARSILGEIDVLISADGGDVFELSTLRSFAGHAWEQLRDAAQEFR